MIDNSGYIFKGIMLTICGIIIAFFPGVITWIFYALGAIIIFGSGCTYVGSLKEGGEMLFGSLIAAGIGFGIMFLPRILTVQIPLIAGIIFAVVGILRLVKTYSKKYDGNKAVSTVIGILLVLAGIFFIVNPFKVSAVIRIIIGVIMILLGIFDFAVAYTIKQRNDNSQPSVVDIDVNSISDSHDD